MMDREAHDYADPGASGPDGLEYGEVTHVFTAPIDMDMEEVERRALVDPMVNIEVQQIETEVARMVIFAADFVVTGQTQVDEATNSLVLMTNAQKRLTELRKVYVDPLNSQVKTINASFKSITDPLDTAIGSMKSAITTFNAKVRELAEKAAAIERLQSEVQQETGEIMAPVPMVPDQARKASTDMGSVTSKVVWKWEVTDFNLLPNDFKLPDIVKINRLVSGGLRETTGLRIYSEEIIAVTARKEPGA